MLTGGTAGVAASSLSRWSFRGGVPGILPISPKWRFVLFGLASIQFSRHPEGLVEYGKRRATRRFNERFDQRERDRASQETSP